MYAELGQVSLLGMSDSEPFVAKDGEEDGTKLEILKLPTLDFHHDCTQTTPTSSSPSSSSTQRQQEDKEINSTSAEKEDTKKAVSFKEIEDDNDGFRTPTSLDHKISEPKQCPPAPRKLKSLKRKASPSNSSSNNSLTITNIEIDFSQMVKKTRT